MRTATSVLCLDWLLERINIYYSKRMVQSEGLSDWTQGQQGPLADDEFRLDADVSKNNVGDPTRMP